MTTSIDHFDLSPKRRETRHSQRWTGSLLIALVIVGAVALFVARACWPRSYDTPSVVGVVAAENVATSGIIDYTLADRTKVHLDVHATEARGIEPHLGDLLIAVGDPPRYVVRVPPAHEPALGCSFDIIGSAVDLGDAVGVHFDALSPDTSLRLPKASGFTSQQGPSTTSQPGRLLGTGSCLNGTGQVTTVVP